MIPATSSISSDDSFPERLYPLSTAVRERTLWLRVKAQDAHILFNGAKLNYRRKRVAV